MNNKIFITGGTGYIGKKLISELLKLGYEVFALVLENSVAKIPKGCKVIIGNALDHLSFADQIAPCQTFIQLVGVPHPSPAKKELFNKIDLVSVKESVASARLAGIDHFIYISVAQETNLMKAYQKVRGEGETMIRNSGMNATIFRPWYVIGPGHYWPLILFPVFKLLEWIPYTKAKAKRMALITLKELIKAMVHAVQHPATGVRIYIVPSIKKIAESSCSTL